MDTSSLAEADAYRSAGTETDRGTGEWPVVPPAPTPTPPPPAQLGPQPPIVDRDAHLVPSGTFSAAPQSPAVPPSPIPAADAFAPATAPVGVTAATRVLTRAWRIPVGTTGNGATVALRTRPVRRPIFVPSSAGNVWQPTFAYGTAAVVAVAFTVVTLPLWLAMYRGAASSDAPLTEVVALAMMLLGAFLTAVTAWVVIVEMRARVRMVDTLGGTGEHEAPGAALNAGYSGLLRPFTQVPAQLGLLAVSLALFVGATVIVL